VPIANLQRAYAEFNKTMSAASAMDIALFSADGDFIHEYFDCVFMGPYSRVDILPCDAEGVLECPFYARDPTGETRNFTPCFGDDAMRGDHRLPFTCGSDARRAIIKYFFREYYTPIKSNNLSRVINEKVLKPEASCRVLKPEACCRVLKPEACCRVLKPGGRVLKPEASCRELPRVEA
jgi:hypothetical protein